VPGLSRLFFKKILGRDSLGFRAFQDIVRVHQQAISTGGNFIPVLWKTRAQGFL
jgi:hypothetical protein